MMILNIAIQLRSQHPVRTMRIEDVSVILYELNETIDQIHSIIHTFDNGWSGCIKADVGCDNHGKMLFNLGYIVNDPDDSNRTKSLPKRLSEYVDNHTNINDIMVIVGYSMAPVDAYDANLIMKEKDIISLTNGVLKIYTSSAKNDDNEHDSLIRRKAAFIKMCDVYDRIIGLHNNAFKGKVMFKLPGKHGYRLDIFPEITMDRNNQEVIIHLKDADAFNVSEDRTMEISQLNGILSIAKVFNSPGLYIKIDHDSTKTSSGFQVVDFEYIANKNVLILYTIHDRQHDSYYLDE